MRKRTKKLGSTKDPFYNKTNLPGASPCVLLAPIPYGRRVSSYLVFGFIIFKDLYVSVELDFVFYDLFSFLCVASKEVVHDFT